MLHIKLPKGKTARAFEACGEYHQTRVFGANVTFRMFQYANACSHSTGDVYLDTKLWAEIKEYYDA